MLFKKYCWSKWVFCDSVTNNTALLMVQRGCVLLFLWLLRGMQTHSSRNAAIVSDEDGTCQYPSARPGRVLAVLWNPLWWHTYTHTHTHNKQKNPTLAGHQLSTCFARFFDIWHLQIFTFQKVLQTTFLVLKTQLNNFFCRAAEIHSSIGTQNTAYS